LALIDCPSLPEFVYVDKDFYEKILLNLISNAFKHTFDGVIEIRISWIGIGAELTVRDTGVGIPSDHLPHIFERFHRVANAKSRTHEGSGIGLALVQELVNLHKGTIKVKSILGQGTTFQVFFPAGKEHLPAEFIQKEKPLSFTANNPQSYVQEVNYWLGENVVELTYHPCPLSDESKKATILLADDNADMRHYIHQILAKHYQIIAVNNGLEALKAAKQNRPDLILSDVMMPQMTGFELVDNLRQDPKLKLVPIILLSARAGEEAKIEGLEIGADDYLIKPFSALELLTRIKTHLNMQKIRLAAQDELKRSEERYQLLYCWERKTREIMQNFQKHLDVDEIFQYVVQAIGHHISTVHCFAFQCDESMEILSIVHHYRDKDGAIFDKGISPKTILEAIKDLSKQECQNHPEWFEIDCHTIMPIQYHESLLATIVIRHEEGRLWTEQEMFFLSTLNEQLKISLSRAKLNADMQRAAQLKNQFISNMSHELRTPLNAIIGYSEMILKGMTNSAIMQNKFVGNIATAGKHLLALINDILDLSKIEAGKFILNFKSISLPELVNEIQILLKELAAAKNIFLHFSISDEIEGIKADPVRLKQILINLLNNAIKFNRQNGRVDMTIEKSLDSLWIIWKISDTGIGIPEDKLSELFTEFYQVDNSASRSYEGTGLGLALSKRLIQLHGGIITVESQENIGSTFSFTLPLSRDNGHA